MNEKRAQFIPFNAVNEFLLPEYRLKIIQQAFAEFNTLPEERQAAINRLVKKLVQVSGFRNSIQAPAPVKARAAVSTFEKSAGFAAQIMGAWHDLHPDLAQKIYDLLKSRGWELLPLEADRSKLPGFLTRWLKEETFEVLDDAFAVMYPGDEAHEYDINMMIAWLSGRLPVEMVEKLDKDD
ncbi:MAG: hypothetical protein ACYC3H_04700 [Bellilinea sp.]